MRWALAAARPGAVPPTPLPQTPGAATSPDPPAGSRRPQAPPGGRAPPGPDPRPGSPSPVPRAAPGRSRALRRAEKRAGGTRGQPLVPGAERRREGGPGSSPLAERGRGLGCRRSAPLKFRPVTALRITHSCPGPGRGPPPPGERGGAGAPPRASPAACAGTAPASAGRRLKGTAPATLTVLCRCCWRRRPSAGKQPAAVSAGGRRQRRSGSDLPAVAAIAPEPPHAAAAAAAAAAARAEGEGREGQGAAGRSRPATLANRSAPFAGPGLVKPGRSSQSTPRGCPVRRGDWPLPSLPCKRWAGPRSG